MTLMQQEKVIVLLVVIMAKREEAGNKPIKASARFGRWNDVERMGRNF